MEDFLHENQSDDNIMTPESLAWKLLMDDQIDDFKGVIMSFIDGNEQENNYENLSGQFEILITIYMEMVFGLLKINHINGLLNEQGELETEREIDLEKSFNPDLNELSIDDLTLFFREKFKKIRLFLSISQIHDSETLDPRDFGSKSEYYCRILLKDLPHDQGYFWTNRHRLDPEKRYTFVIRNDPLKDLKKLDNFYAVCALPGMKVKISFSPINVVENQLNDIADSMM